MTVNLSEYWVGASSRTSAIPPPLPAPVTLFYDGVVVCVCRDVCWCITEWLINSEKYPNIGTLHQTHTELE